MEKTEKFEIFYVRHADTSGASNEDRDTCDINLSELGEKQAILAGERFAGEHFDAVFASPLLRTVKTAAAIAERLDDHPVIELMPELMENGSTYGYHGCSLDYLGKYYDNLKLCEDKVYGNKNGAYKNLKDRDNMRRAKTLIKYFRKRFTYGQKILIVSHGSFGNSFIPAAVNAGIPQYILSINNTSVTKIKYTSDGDKRISFQNDMSHLRPLMPRYEFDV